MVSYSGIGYRLSQCTDRVLSLLRVYDLHTSMVTNPFYVPRPWVRKVLSRLREPLRGQRNSGNELERRVQNEGSRTICSGIPPVGTVIQSREK